MTLTFLELWEIIEEKEMALNQDPPKDYPLMGGGQDSKAMQVVRAGLDIRNSDGPSFWDDFVNLCSNSVGMAELLGVKSSEVQRWSSKIKDTIDQVEESDRNNPEGKSSSSKMINTGDETSEPQTVDKMMDIGGSGQ